jgi:2-(1,2-epoxy-1,2-dihydrophenyl)acetyl-CoA isomerase
MTNDESPYILARETHGAVRVLRLDRPERKNALSDALGWELLAAIEEAAHDDAVRVVAITGRGDAFCSGVDLRDDPAAGAARSPLSAQDDLVDDLGWVGRFPLAIRRDCDKPVVAGVNGVAVGAGMALAMCADLRIASRTARFHPGYVRAGTSPDGGLSWTLPQAIGPERALRFLLESRMIDAEEAARLGIVGEVVEAERLEQSLLDTCARLAESAPIAVRQTKRLVHRAAAGADLEAHLRDEMRYVYRGLRSEDGREAVAAVLEKRKPVFHGR